MAFGWIIEPIVKAKVAEMLEVFGTPEFKAAAENLALRGLLTAIPQMKLDMDNLVVKFPQPDVTVPILKGVLNALEDKLKTSIK